ncbi:Os1348 family NHLP clan protein [uncultured Clostridium sp.]|uniref:Os1348 family NHLP clan protein n=1 Tax=uncultured Clostridium sp. TaxID=59620 RepID=UPI00258D4271|nr:Os1348 family NHLP clan protein [uncultured Clostridium sp.]MDU1349831.1 Os1348 family NHLP clan protein [Clostridium argentinense]
MNENVNNKKTEIKDLITRAVTDEEFKKQLIEDPDNAMKGYELSEVQRLLIKSLRTEDLEKLTPQNLEEYFSADSAVYTPDVDEELNADEAGEDDI